MQVNILALNQGKLYIFIFKMQVIVYILQVISYEMQVIVNIFINSLNAFCCKKCNLIQ